LIPRLARERRPLCFAAASLPEANLARRNPAMADNDRWRNDQRTRDDDRRRGGSGGDWGYPRSRDDERGFGGSGRGPSWYGSGNGDYRPDSDRDWGGERRRERPFGASDAYGRLRRREDDAYGEFRGRERDYGDSAGYGTGGSALDWRDVMGDDDRRGRDRDRGYARREGREPGFTDIAFGHGFGSGYEGRDYSGEGRERGYGRGRDERGFLERAGDEIASWFGADTPDDRRDRRPGEHRGRGPKGYQRSDERIRDDVSDRLTDDPHIDASDIEVTVSSREVILSGTVARRFEKRHAEDIAESVSGVEHVQNNLRIRQSAGTDTGLLSGGGTMGGLAGAGGTNV
jgi:osmotically-inducible protein OsmY